jgi:alpha-acetolactate decarboxylase
LPIESSSTPLLGEIVVEMVSEEEGDTLFGCIVPVATGEVVDGLTVNGLVMGIADDDDEDGLSVLMLDGSFEKEKGLILAIKEGPDDG